MVGPSHSLSAMRWYDYVSVELVRKGRAELDKADSGVSNWVIVASGTSLGKVPPSYIKLEPAELLLRSVVSAFGASDRGAGRPNSRGLSCMDP